MSWQELAQISENGSRAAGAYQTYPVYAGEGAEIALLPSRVRWGRAFRAFRVGGRGGVFFSHRRKAWRGSDTSKGGPRAVDGGDIE